ncbi:MAG TPA: hypothetical protein VFX49_23730 [Chloroflexota bacterium]|nr:hypothetical protein [Chloroflexota bacterium]
MRARNDRQDQVGAIDDPADERQLVDVVLAANQVGLAEGVEVQRDQVGEGLEAPPQDEREGAVEQQPDGDQGQRPAIGPDWLAGRRRGRSLVFKDRRLT